jgi:O-antigen/teichoic acid export membrane protein
MTAREPLRRCVASRGVAVNTAYTGLNILIRLGVGLAMLPLLLDGIGSQRTALFIFATTLTGYFVAVDNSVNQSVTRYVAEHRARDQHGEVAATVRSSLVALTAMGLLAAAILVVLGLTAATALFPRPQVRGVAQVTIFATAATSALYWPSRVGVAALQGLERYDQASQVQIATSSLLLFGLGGLAYEHASVVLLVVVYGLITVLEGIVSGMLAWRPLGVSRAWLRGDWLRGERLRGVVKFGGAAFLIGISDTLLNSFDRAIVASIVGAVAIISYDTAQRPQQAVRVITTLSGLALVSPVARLWARDQKQQMKSLIVTATAVGIVMAAPICVLVIVLAHPFLAAWLGDGYARYTTFLQLFTSFWILVAATPALSSALYGIGRLGGYARLVLIAYALSLPLSIVLALAWGTVGVIWGTVIPSTLVVPIFIRMALRLLEISAREFVRALLLPYGLVLVWAGVMVAAKLLLSPTGFPGLLAFSVPALLVCWGAAVPLLRERIRAARLLGTE